MPRGGHVRSGRYRDPRSARSDAQGYATVVLPVAGFQGRIPGLNQFVPKPAKRHRELWEQHWRTPQACVWIKERWRWPVVAELVRLMALTEAGPCPVGVYGAIRQRRDDLGLSTAGQRAEGWEIPSGVASAAVPATPVPPGDEVGARRVRRSQTLGDESGSRRD